MKQGHRLIKHAHQVQFLRSTEASRLKLTADKLNPFSQPTCKQAEDAGKVHQKNMVVLCWYRLAYRTTALTRSVSDGKRSTVHGKAAAGCCEGELACRLSHAQVHFCTPF